MGQVLAMTEHGFSNLQGSGDRPGHLVWARAPENVGRGWDGGLCIWAQGSHPELFLLTLAKNLKELCILSWLSRATMAPN